MHYRDTFGHHVSLLPRDSNTETMTRILPLAPVRGLMPRIKWRDVDTDFSAISAWLDFGARNGVVITPMIEDKTFDGTIAAPADLERFCAPNAAGGYTAARWHSAVRERFSALVNSLYSTFGNHLAFEGLALQETAPGLDARDLSATGYSVEAYSEYYLDIFQSARYWSLGTVARPAKRVFFHQNYAPGTPSPIDLTIEKAIAEGLTNFALGGPDVWPDDAGLVRQAYPRYARWAGFGVPTFAGMSLPSQDRGIVDTLVFARNNLLASRIFWVYNAKRFAEVASLIANDG